MGEPITTLRTNLPTALKLLRLDPIHCPAPDFSSLPIPYTYTELPSPPPPTSELIPLLKEAHILITTRYFLPSSLLSQLPNLLHIAILAIGTDHVDLNYCKEHEISVSNIPAASNEAVSEHGLSMYLALRRNITAMHEKTREGLEWKEKGTLTGYFHGGPMVGFKGEVVGIVGGGELGRGFLFVSLVFEKGTIGKHDKRSSLSGYSFIFVATFSNCLSCNLHTAEAQLIQPKVFKSRYLS